MHGSISLNCFLTHTLHMESLLLLALKTVIKEVHLQRYSMNVLPFLISLFIFIYLVCVIIRLIKLNQYCRYIQNTSNPY